MKRFSSRLASESSAFFTLAASIARVPVILVLWAVVFAFATAPGPLHGQATYVFGKATVPANGTGTSLVQGDFNGDGSTDFVWANPSTNTVSIVLSMPNGAYAPKQDYVAAATSSLVGSIVVADFNNDGKLDLAVGNNDGNISFLYGNGDGTFQPRVALAIPPAGNAAGLAVGDFNRDGNMDLVVTSSLGTYVYLGDGKGNFTQDANAPTGVLSLNAAVADFNNDGFADIMIGDLASHGVMWLGDGKGGFRTAPNTPGAIPGAIADFNGDGILDDIYTVKQCGHGICHYYLYEYLGKGDGTFNEQVISIPVFGTALAADFNQDGKMDLLLTPGGILLGNGDGSFQAPLHVPQSNPTMALVGDFNHDGQLDFAALDKGGFLTVALGNQGKFPSPSTDTVATTTTPAHAIYGDFNNDGKLDQMTVDGSILVQFGNGDGTFQSPISSPIVSSAIGGTVLGDFNKDGNLDLLVLTNQTSNVEFYVYLGNGNGTFQAGVPVSASNRWPLAGVAGDFNGDGNLDVAVAAQNGTGVDVFLGNGDGTFKPGVTYATCFPGFNFGMAARDLNGDGHLDLAMVCDDFQGGMNVLIGNGDGTFKPAVAYHAGGDYDASLALGDFNGDGKTDVAISGFTGVTTFLGNGDGTFQAGIVTSSICVVAELVAVDFNYDGKTDLACSYNGNNTPQMSLLLSHGDGTFLPSFLPMPWSLDPGPTAVDLNGDGALDLISSVVSPTSMTSYYLPSLPVAFLSPAQLNFGSQTVGTTSAPLAVTLANPGAAPLSVSAATTTGDFAVSNDGCGSTLAVAASCVIEVTFTPTAQGPRAGTLVIPSNSVGGKAVFALSGQGVGGGGPVVTLSPTSLTFATQIILTASQPQAITMTNSGTAPLSISSIAITGVNAPDYTQTSNCGNGLPVNGTCSINVIFKPVGIDTRTAAVTITDNAPGSPQTVPLTGVGSQVKIKPAALKFPKVLVNSSFTKNVGFANVGTTAVHISGISITGANSGDFTEKSGCGGTVAPKSKCTISVTFIPSAKGPRSATLAVADDGGGSPQTVPLSGTGK